MSKMTDAAAGIALCRKAMQGLGDTPLLFQVETVLANVTWHRLSLKLVCVSCVILYICTSVMYWARLFSMASWLSKTRLQRMSSPSKNICVWRRTCSLPLLYWGVLYSRLFSPSVAMLCIFHITKISQSFFGSSPERLKPWSVTEAGERKAQRQPEAQEESQSGQAEGYWPW